MKMTIGVWIVCEERQSEFYHKGTTGQTFDSLLQPRGALEPNT